MQLFRRLLLPCLVFLAFVFDATAQQASLLGSWQLVRHVSCMEESASQDPDGGALRREMTDRAPAASQVVTFGTKARGRQSQRILNSGRLAHPRKFLYRYNGEVLLILDKKSQTVTDSYLVEKLSADSLIVSHRNRPCETRIFMKIDEE